MIQALYLFLFFSVSLIASPSATEIVRRGDSSIRGKSQQSLMKMTIQRTSFRRDLTLRSWTSDNINSLVEIIQPSKEEGIVSLRKHNDMWNYLPKTDQTVRIPTSMMLQSWMGSDFTNDDLMKISSIVDNYNHKLMKSESLSGEAVDLIECVPKPNAPVVWGKILYWARKKDSLPVKEEYYDEKGQLIRTLTLTDFGRMDDRVIPKTLTIRKAGNEQEFTEIQYEQVYYNRTIPDELFTKDQLKQNSNKGKDLKALWFGVQLGE